MWIKEVEKEVDLLPEGSQTVERERERKETKLDRATAMAL